MNIDTTLIFHAVYVAFAFAVMLFGALAYRQIADSSAMRGLGLGEDRDGFVSAPGVLLMGICMIVSIVIAWLCFTYAEPSIYIYALPMILALNVVQLTMRLYFQRTLFRTFGVVVKSALFENKRAIFYTDVIDAELRRDWLWVTITLRTKHGNDEDGTGGDVATFRIFRTSATRVYRILRGWCPCPVRIIPQTTSL